MDMDQKAFSDQRRMQGNLALAVRCLQGPACAFSVEMDEPRTGILALDIFLRGLRQLPETGASEVQGQGSQRSDASTSPRAACNRREASSSV